MKNSQPNTSFHVYCTLPLIHDLDKHRTLKALEPMLNPLSHLAVSRSRQRWPAYVLAPCIQPRAALQPDWS